MNFLQERPLFVICTIPLLILYALNYALYDCESVIALVTANTIITHTYVWNMITACFYETNPIKLAIDLGLLWWTSKLIGRPNIEQFGLYFVFTILSCTIGASIYYFFRFVGSGREEFLLVPIYGFSGILMSFFMYIRRMHGNLPIHNAMPKITFHQVPTFYLLIQLICGIILGFRNLLFWDFIFAFLAFLFAWSYLKFYYKFAESLPITSTEASVTTSEEFQFVNMFPQASHIVIIPFTIAFYNIMSLIGLFPPLEINEKKHSYHHLRPVTSGQEVTYTPLTGSGSSATSTSGSGSGMDGAGQGQSNGGVTGVKDVITERRRAKALKMLDAKLLELHHREIRSEGWDDEDEEDDVKNSNNNEEGKENGNSGVAPLMLPVNANTMDLLLDNHNNVNSIRSSMELTKFKI